MSDYIQKEQGIGRILRSFMAVILAMTIAFAYSGISATQFAYADDVTYTATYDVPGMDPAPKDDENQIATDGEIDLSNYKDKYPGYELVSTTIGDEEPDTNVDTNITVNNGDTVTFTYALITYKIEYKGIEGAVGTSENPSSYTVNKAIVLNDPTKTGYSFDGWTWEGQPSAQKNVNLAAGSETGNLTFTANWTQVFTVSYVLNGGNSTDQLVYSNLRKGSDTPTISNPTRENFEFKGWDPTPTATVDGDATYTAQWDPKSPDPTATITYTIKYVDAEGNEIEAAPEEEKTAPVAEGATSVTVQASEVKKIIPNYAFQKLEIERAGEMLAQTGDTLTIVNGDIVTVTYIEMHDVTYTVKYEGLENTQEPVTQTETVPFDVTTIAVQANDINKTVAGYTIASVKLENGTVVKAGDNVPSGSIITVTYEKIPAQKTGAWVQSGSRWWYKYSDGTWPANEWLNDNGKYYHFDSAGWMQTGWLSTNKGVNNNALDAATWFYLDGSGSAHTGWLLLGNTWYYLNTSADVEGTNLLATMVGAPTQGALTVVPVKGKEYCFAYSGAMQTGWKKINNTWFYFDASGAQVENGWAMSGGKWFWLSSDGSMATSSWVDGNNYYVGGDGAMLTGWFKVDSTWFYANASGKKLVNQWLLSGGKWYWLNADGSMAESAWVDNGKYYVTTGGAMVTGWNRIGTNSAGDPTLDAEGDHAWYYFNASGLKTVNAWVKSGGKWYWLTDDGTMAENEWVDKGNYYMGADGVMETGWKRISVNGEGQTTIDKQGRPSYYYFNESGLKMTNTWVARDGNDYWLGKDGAVVQGQWVDNGKYYVNDEGVYVPNYKADPDSENN